MRSLLLALELARVIAGEAPGCEPITAVAVAQVYHRRIEANIQGGWFGWQTPDATDLAVALTWQTWPNVTGEALYMLGPGDTEKVTWVKTAMWSIECNDTTLTAWE